RRARRVPTAAFFHAHSFFHRDLVERVDRHFEIGKVHARAIALHAHLEIIIEHPFHRDEDFHAGKSWLQEGRDFGPDTTQPAAEVNAAATSVSTHQTADFAALPSRTVSLRAWSTFSDGSDSAGLPQRRFPHLQPCKLALAHP